MSGTALYVPFFCIQWKLTMVTKTWAAAMLKALHISSIESAMPREPGGAMASAWPLTSPPTDRWGVRMDGDAGVWRP